MQIAFEFFNQRGAGGIDDFSVITLTHWADPKYLMFWHCSACQYCVSSYEFQSKLSPKALCTMRL